MAEERVDEVAEPGLDIDVVTLDEIVARLSELFREDERGSEEARS